MSQTRVSSTDLKVRTHNLIRKRLLESEMGLRFSVPRRVQTRRAVSSQGQVLLYMHSCARGIERQLSITPIEFEIQLSLSKGA